MNFHLNSDWRNRRNLLNHQHIGTMIPFGHTPFSIANYSTDTQQKKTEMKEHFRDDILLSKLHMMPNPLQKNLADTIVTSQHSDCKKMCINLDETHTNNMTAKMETTTDCNSNPSTFSGIASFISGVFNVISGSFFQKQPKSEVECFDKEFDVCSHTFNGWQSSNFEDLNKTSLGDDQFSSSNIDITNINHSEMINDCRNAAEQCEDKLGKVRLLLANGVIPKPQKPKPRRQHKVYVEPNSVEDNFEDAICPEDCSILENQSIVEHISPCNIQNQELHEIDAEKVKTEAPPVHKYKELVDNIDLNEKTDSNLRDVIQETTKEKITEPSVIVLSCEEKLNKLKELLNEKKNKIRTSVCAPDSPLKKNYEDKNNRQIKMCRDKSISTPKVKDKRFKNPHKLRTARKGNLQRNIVEDMSFANEIDCGTSSIENSPSINPSILNEMCHSEDSNNSKDYFDEVSGRFRTSSTTESDDSFQIVFTDSPKFSRPRKVSDCDSEDSFIVFEDPSDCYTSTDVFGDELSDTDSEYSDSESDHSDAGCAVMELACKLSHALSRTVSDLTDDSLYENRNKLNGDMNSDSEDEIDSSPKDSCQVMPEAVNFANEVKNIKDIQPYLSKGSLINGAKKLHRSNMPPKKVHFSPQPPKVHVMRVWAFAARQARIGHWERHALDRDRFKRRIADVEMAVSWVLKPQHRSRIMFQRFMPWWNAQKRKEIEERKFIEENKIKEETQNSTDANSYGEVNNRPVNSVDVEVTNNDNINDLVTGIGDKNILHNLDNEIKSQNLKNTESGKSFHKKIHIKVTDENGLEKDDNFDSNSADKVDKNYKTELNSPDCCTVKSNTEIHKDEKDCKKSINTVFVNGFEGFDESNEKIYCGADFENDLNEKRNEKFEKSMLIGKKNIEGDIIKEINGSNDKLLDTNVGCNLKSTLSGI